MAVGRHAPRIDGIEKVTGAARFTADLSFPGLLEAKVLRSPLPHAKIEFIDTRGAEALPGVIAVLTRDDLKDINPFYGNCLRDRPVVAIDRVRYVGEPVAVIAAENAGIAEEALARIHVGYDELPRLATVEDALAPGAPLLHEGLAEAGEFHDMAGLGDSNRDNICHREHYESGDIGRGFAESDEVIEESFEFPMVYQYAMEPHTAVARVSRQGITLWTSSAHPFLIRSELAHMFHWPQSKVEVIVPFVGGAYGSKSYFKIEPLIVAMARKTAGRPVRLAQTVPESMLTTRRHSARCELRTGVKHDGTLVARAARVIMDTGAYADNGPRVARRAVSRMIGPYRLGSCKVDVIAVYTNTVPAGSMRSIGGPQTIWALESHMDTIAERLRIDPVEFRMRNLLDRGATLKNGATPVDADLRQGMNAAAEAISRSERVFRECHSEAKPKNLAFGNDENGQKLHEEYPEQSRKLQHDTKPFFESETRRGRGVAVGVSDSEAMPVSTALVRLLADGSLILIAGTTEVGQGARTILSQIVAQEMNVELDRITMRGTDTAATPFDRSTGASRSTTVMGTAVRAAAIDLRAQLITAAAEALNTQTENVRLENGNASAGEQSLSYGAVVSAFFGMPGGELIGRGYSRPGVGFSSQFPLFWETGMGAAAIRVDPETGSIELDDYVTVADVGKAINPLQAEAQDEGAAVQGLGHTLFESLQYDNGQPLNANLIDYRVPRFTDLPERFDSLLIENGDGPGPYGAKGMGESGIVSVAPAVGNALAHATGARVRELPLTPERIWRALKNSQKTETTAADDDG